VKAPFYGWRNVIGVMVVYGGICGNITYAYGVFLPAMEETFHWPRATLSGPYTVFLLVGGLLGPLAGITCARFGARRNILLANLVAAFGLLGLSQSTQIGHIYLFFGIMCGIGIAFGEFIPSTTVINAWFVKRRSLAMGLLFAAGGMGGFIMPPLIGLMIDRFGWPTAWFLLGVFHLTFVVVLGGLIIKNKPEDYNQLPDGASYIKTQGDGGDWKVMDAFFSPSLWGIVGVFAITLFIVNVLSTHQVSYLRDRGFSPFFSASALGFMLGASVVGRLISGFLGTRFEGRKILAASLILMAAGILSLILAYKVIFVYLYAVFTGLGFGGAIVSIPQVTVSFFGQSHYPQIIGWTAPLVTVAGAVSPYIAGYLRDLTGNYTIPLVTILFLAVIGVQVTIFLRRPEKK